MMTGDSSIINGENAIDLLPVAEQFYCDSLKLACQRFIQEGIDSENVCSLLEIADGYRATPLFNACLWYILVNYDKMSVMPEYEGMAEYLKARVYETRSPMKAIEIFAKLAKEDEKERDLRILLNVAEAVANLAKEDFYASSILKHISFEKILSWTELEGSRVQIEATRAIANFALHAPLINTTIKALPVWQKLCKSKDRTVVLHVSRGIANVATVPDAQVVQTLLKYDIVSVLNSLMESASEIEAIESIVGALHNLVTTNKESLPFISTEPIVIFLCKSLQKNQSEDNLFYRRCLQLLAQILTLNKKLRSVAHKVDPPIENSLQSFLEKPALQEDAVMLVIQIIAPESRNRWNRIIGTVSALSGPKIKTSEKTKQLAFIMLLEISQWAQPKKKQ